MISPVENITCAIYHTIATSKFLRVIRVRASARKHVNKFGWMVCIWAQLATGWFSKFRSRFCTWGPKSRTLEGAHRRILSTSVWMGQPPRGLSKAKLNKRTPVYIFWIGKLGFRLNIALQFEQYIQKGENCLSWIPRHFFIQRRVRFEENMWTKKWDKRVGTILGGRWNRRLVCRVQEPQPRTTAWQHQPWRGWHRGERPVRTHNHRNTRTRSWNNPKTKKIQAGLRNLCHQKKSTLRFTAPPLCQGKKNWCAGTDTVHVCWEEGNYWGKDCGNATYFDTVV